MSNATGKQGRFYDLEELAALIAEDHEPAWATRALTEQAQALEESA